MTDEAAKIDEIAATSLGWSDEELASRIVGLLIEDKGSLNAYQRTIVLAIRIVRAQERLKQ